MYKHFLFKKGNTFTLIKGKKLLEKTFVLIKGNFEKVISLLFFYKNCKPQMSEKFCLHIVLCTHRNVLIIKIIIIFVINIWSRRIIFGAGD